MQLRNGLVVTRPSINVLSDRHRTYKSRFRYFNKMQKDVMTSQSQKKKRAELIRPSGNFIMKEF